MERLILAAILCAGGGGVYAVANSHQQSVRTPAIAPYGTSPLLGGGVGGGLSQSSRLPPYGSDGSSLYGSAATGLDSDWPGSSVSDFRTSTGPTSYSQIGGSTYGSDGTSCNSIGSSTYCSGPGGSTSYTQIGGSIYGSDGSSCSSIGSSTYCSGGR